MCARPSENGALSPQSATRRDARVRCERAGAADRHTSPKRKRGSFDRRRNPSLARRASEYSTEQSAMKRLLSYSFNVALPHPSPLPVGEGAVLNCILAILLFVTQVGFQSQALADEAAAPGVPIFDGLGSNGRKVTTASAETQKY